MIRVYGFLYVESELDWNKNYNANWNRISNNAIDKKPTTFPAFFRLQESWDSHYCGTWVPCEKDLMIKACLAEIAEYQNILNTIEPTT